VTVLIAQALPFQPTLTLMAANDHNLLSRVIIIIIRVFHDVVLLQHQQLDHTTEAAAFLQDAFRHTAVAGPRSECHFYRMFA